MRTVFQKNSLIPTRTEEILLLNLSPEKTYKVFWRERRETLVLTCVGAKATVSLLAGGWVLASDKVLDVYTQKGGSANFTTFNPHISMWDVPISQIDTIKEL